MKVITVLGTRPEIIKLSPLMPLLNSNFEHLIVHTGQHYSDGMGRIFFEQLNLPAPDFMLEISSISQVEQTARMMINLEKIFVAEKPDLVLIQGDTNSSLAGAVTAAKLRIPIAHIEAGCRSFNLEMPEEVNRIIVDHCSTIYFVPDKISFNNLLNEGINKERMFLVGSTVIDACLRNREFAKSSDILDRLGFSDKPFVLLTMHRAENTNNHDMLAEIIKGLNEIAKQIQIIFPIHPRTKKALKASKISISPLIKVIEPVGYLDVLKLIESAHFVVTDSGGVQEEAAVLGNTALILRNETEWMEYVKAGRNKLIGTEADKIVATVSNLLKKPNDLIKIKQTKINLSKGVDKKIVNILKNQTEFLTISRVNVKLSLPSSPVTEKG